MQRGLICQVLRLFAVSIVMGTQVQAAPIRANVPLVSSLEPLISKALDTHPQVKMAELAYLSAKAKVPAARALPDPQLVAGIRHVGINQFTIGEEPMSGVGASLQQNYPNPTKLNIKEQIAYHQSLALEQVWYLQQRQIRRQIQQRYFDLLENQQAQAINLEIQSLFKTLQETAEAYYKLGKIPQKEIWRIKTERSRLELEYLELKQQFQLKLNFWRRDLGENTPQIASLQLEQTQFPHPELPTIKDLQKRLEQHPRWRQQSQNVQVSQLQWQLAASQLNPDYMLMGGLTQRGLLDPVWELRAGMTLPIYAEDKVEPEIEAARLAVSAEQAQSKNIQQMLTQELNQAWIQIEQSRRQQALYQQQLIPELRLVFDAAVALFPVGQSDLTELIIDITQLLRYQRENLALRHQESLAWSDLLYLTGAANE